MSLFSRVAVMIALALPLWPSVANIQLTPDGNPTGACTGSGVTILTPAQFSTSGNWGAGASQIGADTVVLACGTFTGTSAIVLWFPGGGTAGHPVVFTCDAGTVFTSPRFGGGSNAAIVITNRNHITMNGAGCTIRNTDNGSGLGSSAYSTGLWATGSNLIIENWTISNIYQHTSLDDHGTGLGGNLPAGIITSGSDITVRGNHINDSAYGVYHNVGTADARVTIQNNTTYRCNHHIAIGAATSSNTISDVIIEGNTITDAVNWDDSNNIFHHNGVFVFQGTGGDITGVDIRNNLITGDFGEHATSFIYINPNSLEDPVTGIRVYNNLLINGSTVNGPTNGFIVGLGSSNTGGQAYNNTIVCGGVGFAAIKMDGSTNIMKNNIIKDCRYGIYVNDGRVIAESDYNLFYNVGIGGYAMRYSSTNYVTVAAWTAATGFDADSLTSDPLLTTSYTLGAGSPAIGAGANLSGLGITALNSDKNGVARGSIFDIGAYEYAAPPPPTTFRGVLRGGSLK